MRCTSSGRYKAGDVPCRTGSTVCTDHSRLMSVRWPKPPFLLPRGASCSPTVCVRVQRAPPVVPLKILKTYILLVLVNIDRTFQSQKSSKRVESCYSKIFRVVNHARKNHNGCRHCSSRPSAGPETHQEHDMPLRRGRHIDTCAQGE